MKILLISSGSGSRGGGEYYLLRLAAGLVDLGHAVHVLVSTDAAMDELAEAFDPDVEVHRLDLRNTYRRGTRVIGAVLDSAQQVRIGNFIRTLAPDVVHVNQQVAEDGLDFLLGARKAGIPLVSTIHIAHSARHLGARAGALRDVVTGAVLGRVGSRHIVVARSARDDLVSRRGFARLASRVHVVHNGVYDPTVDTDTSARAAVRAEWDMDDDAVVLGVVGRIEAQKNPQLLVDVLGRLAEKQLPVRAVWVGDGPLRGEIEWQARDAGVAELFRVDGWRDDVPERLQGMDVFMLPSRFEGLPLALLEAFCAGKPCCVSDVDGMCEAITDGVEGYLCLPDDIDQWVARISDLVGDESLRRAMGEAAQRTGRERFSIARMAEETLAVYGQAIAADRAA